MLIPHGREQGSISINLNLWFWCFSEMLIVFPQYSDIYDIFEKTTSSPSTLLKQDLSLPFSGETTSLLTKSNILDRTSNGTSTIISLKIYNLVLGVLAARYYIAFLRSTSVGHFDWRNFCPLSKFECGTIYWSSERFDVSGMRPTDCLRSGTYLKRLRYSVDFLQT